MTDDDEAVRALLVRDGERMDAADLDGVGSLLVDGALATEDGIELGRGAEAVGAFHRSVVVLHDGSPRTEHLVLGP